MEILKTAFVILALLSLHELGHVISAKLIGVRIVKVGFSFAPLPHPYVVVENLDFFYQRLIYLLAGIAMTVLLLIIFKLSGLIYYSFIFYAFAIEILLETNPFYSDLTLLALPIHQHRQLSEGISRGKISGMGLIYANSYIFSSIWYLHLILWSVLIYLLFAEKILII
ncbi:MAG: hypothetical protein AAF363_02275 [Bacteroidota bacterium]